LSSRSHYSAGPGFLPIAQCLIDRREAFADMLLRVKRFAAPLILSVPAVAAASPCPINVQEQGRADA